MRIVFIGAGEIAVDTARALIDNKHEVVIIEKEQNRIEQLSDELDCSFLHGDGGRPAILREADPKRTDILFCLSDSDQANIIASLVARSMGFSQVVTSIQDADFEGICRELSLERTIVPGRTISRHLVDIVRGVDTLELSTILKDEARLFTFVARKEDAKPISDLALPEDSRVICYYRNGQFAFAEDRSALDEGDEVVILTRSDRLPDLRERWQPKQTENS